MKKLNFWLLASLFVGALAFTACSSSNDDDGGSGPQGGGSGGFNPPTVVNMAVSGIVRSGTGAPLSGVKVTAGTFSVTTSYNGMFQFTQVNGSVIKFEKDGYATITRALSADDANFDVVMTGAQSESFSASSAKTLDVGWNGMKVDLPASYVDENGSAYTGNVTAKSSYLNPDDADFAQSMPGNLTAIRSDQSEASLISYGMVAVELTGDNGQKLQPGTPATLTFPVPANAKKIDGQLPPQMPLWTFDEATGLWKEEGFAKLNDAGTEYVGTVTHFSWYNLDYPQSRAYLNVKVVDANGKPLPNICVDFDGQRSGYTNAQGIASCTVPCNTPMYVLVTSESYCDYAATIDQYGYKTVDPAKLVKKENVVLDAGKTETITLTMPASSVVKGRITNENGTPFACALWMEYNNTSTNSVISNSNGEYSIYAPYGYTGAAKIVVFCADGYLEYKDITLNGVDQTVDIAVNSSSTTDMGYVYVKGEGMNRKFDLGVPPSGVFDNAVSINGGSMYIYLYSQAPSATGIGMLSFNVSIPNYDETKTSFTGSFNLRWAVWNDQGEDWYSVFNSLARQKGETPTYVPIEVIKTNDIYTIKINNVDAYYGLERYDEIEPVWTPVKVTTTFSAK